MPRETNLQKICADIPITRQALGELVKNGIVPGPPGRGRWNYRKVMSAYIDYLRKRTNQGGANPKRESLIQEEKVEKIRGLKLKNDKEEKIQRDENLRGDIDIGEVADQLDKILVG